MVFRRLGGTYGKVAVLVALVVGAMLFAVPAWSAQDQERQRVSEAQRAKIERLSDAQAEEQFVRAAQASDSSGDLAGETVTVERNADKEVTRILIDEENCRVGNNARTFRDTDGDVAVAVDDDGAEIDSNNNRVIVRGDNPDQNNEPIVFADDGNGKDLQDPVTVLSSSGIDCVDPDDDDGFDDELLLLLLLELLEDDDNGDGGDGDNGDGDNGDDGENGDDGDDGDGDFDEGEDLDGDGDVDQEDELLEAQSELDDETTDGEFDAAGEDDDGPAVSATAEDGQAEASTPGAVASAGGDPDELEPLRSVPEDVDDEIPTSGPLPNTGGAPLWAYALPALGGLILAAAVIRKARGGD